VEVILQGCFYVDVILQGCFHVDVFFKGVFMWTSFFKGIFMWTSFFKGVFVWTSFFKRSNPRESMILSTRPGLWGSPSLLCNGYRVSFPGVKLGVVQSLANSTEVKERVDL
jgi:hypothetical protein